MIWQGIDKRRFPRANYSCKVSVVRNDLKETFSTYTENIGIGGVCVTLPKELPKFCPVGLIIYFQDVGGILACDGRVVWMVQADDKFDAGIEFIGLRHADCLRIEKIVDKCLSGQ